MAKFNKVPVKIVFMYKLKKGIDPEKFEKWFYDIHVPDVMRYPGITTVRL
jgi:hypothetical protein